MRPALWWDDAEAGVHRYGGAIEPPLVGGIGVMRASMGFMASSLLTSLLINVLSIFILSFLFGEGNACQFLVTFRAYLEVSRREIWAEVRSTMPDTLC